MQPAETHTASLFSRFTISTTSQQYIRVRSANLIIPPSEGTEGVKVFGAGPVSKDGIVCAPGTTSQTRVTSPQIITPAHPANFVFRVTSENGPGTHDCADCIVLTQISSRQPRAPCRVSINTRRWVEYHSVFGSALIQQYRGGATRTACHLNSRR
jgi:hypothetical protein